MSDTVHTVFSLFAACAIAFLLCLFSRVCRSEGSRELVLKISAILTVVIHYSSLYVDFLSTGTAVVEENMLFLLYPCNIAMWLLLISAFIKNKHSSIFKLISEGCFYLGVVGGVIGILFNENYISNPTLLDYDILKGLLSHAVMLFGSLFLLVGGYVRIRVDNMASVLATLSFMIIDGVSLVLLYRLFGQEPPNTMFLLENPFPEIPWFNSFTLGALAALLIFMLTLSVEHFVLPQEKRWIYSFKAKIKERKIK